MKEGDGYIESIHSRAIESIFSEGTSRCTSTTNPKLPKTDFNFAASASLPSRLDNPLKLTLLIIRQIPLRWWPILYFSGEIGTAGLFGASTTSPEGEGGLSLVASLLAKQSTRMP